MTVLLEEYFNKKAPTRYSKKRVKYQNYNRWSLTAKCWPKIARPLSCYGIPPERPSVRSFVKTT
jgi:hypothetical protein